MLHEDLPADQVNNMVSIDGFSKGTGGAKITLDFKGVGNIKIVETKTGAVQQLNIATRLIIRCRWK
jgi:hypothetical protein